MVLTIQPGRRDIIPSRVEFQADNAQLVRSTGANVSVMALQGPKYSPQKSRPLESGHRRHGVCIAIECSYKLDQKTNLNFCVNYAHFRKSGHKLSLARMFSRYLLFKFLIFYHSSLFTFYTC